MKNIKLLISYDGTKYNGWQKQGNTSNTIQERLEETIARVTGESIELAGAGRTDAGVHALGQTANFRISDKAFNALLQRNKAAIDALIQKAGSVQNTANAAFITADDVFANDTVIKTADTEITAASTVIRNELNQYLPQDIRILSVCMAEERFHARLNAKGKHYSYRIDNSPVARIFDRKYVTRIEPALDLGRMLQASRVLIGEHDFKSFCSNKRMRKSTVRTIEKIEMTQEDGMIKTDFYGNGFLYHMIRIIMGTLIEVGLHKREPEEMEQILLSLDRSEAGYLAPAAGLFLEEVYYLQ